MRFNTNKGLDKYIHPKCNDGSLDMRFKANKGLDKYNFWELLQMKHQSPINIHLTWCVKNLGTGGIEST